MTIIEINPIESVDKSQRTIPCKEIFVNFVTRLRKFTFQTINYALFSHD